jgi:hypothetical protein
MGVDEAELAEDAELAELAELADDAELPPMGPHALIAVLLCWRVCACL